MNIEGVQIANTIFSNLKKRVSLLKKKGIAPHLAVILVGDEPSSVSYVNQKEIKGEKIGVKITIHQLPLSTPTKSILSLLNDLNHLTSIHGIIVQRPLPQHLDSKLIKMTIDPKKDVDGFHPNSKFQPPISLAVLKILDEVNWKKTEKIVVIGKGETGGKPIIDTFKKMGIEPQIIDSKTPNPETLTKKADIIISAVGKSNVVRPEMIKNRAILISVGLHKGTDGKLQGDYEEEKIKDIASFYTPTPGGVGPVNVAMLLKNLVNAA